jgi:hypothetical protein
MTDTEPVSSSATHVAPAVPAEEVVDVVDEKNNVIRSAKRAEVRGKNLRHRATFIFMENSK